MWELREKVIDVTSAKYKPLLPLDTLPCHVHHPAHTPTHYVHHSFHTPPHLRTAWTICRHSMVTTSTMHQHTMHAARPTRQRPRHAHRRDHTPPRPYAAMRTTWIIHRKPPQMTSEYDLEECFISHLIFQRFIAGGGAAQSFPLVLRDIVGPTLHDSSSLHLE